jgi:hypothetical protein
MLKPIAVEHSEAAQLLRQPLAAVWGPMPQASRIPKKKE